MPPPPPALAITPFLQRVARHEVSGLLGEPADERGSSEDMDLYSEVEEVQDSAQAGAGLGGVGGGQ